MDLVNSSFVALSDLEGIDAQIHEINAQKRALADQIAARNARPDAPKPQFSPQVLEVISEIARLTPESSAAEYERLASAFGPLAVLARLRTLSEKRAACSAHLEQLQYAASVEEQVALLTENSAIDAFTETAAKARAVAEPLRGPLLAAIQAAAEAKKNPLAQELADALAEIRWLAPKEAVSISSAKLSEISSLFSRLVDLQAASGAPQYPHAWWALSVLLQPFKLRFTYHFQEASKTNRLSKPEWALNYAETFLDETLPTLEMVVGDTFARHNRIGVFEILATVLAPVREKLLAMVATINKNIAACAEDEKALDQNGRLLSHLIFETTSFDQRLRTTYKYNPYIDSLTVPPKRKWMGLTSDILVENDRESVAVNNWLSVELRLAKNRFDTEILQPANAFEIDYNYSASSDSPTAVLKPSYSAYGLSQLFDNLTSHFKTISIVKIQLKYVSKIQLVFFDEYAAALKSQLQKFDHSLSSKLLANLYGSAKDSTQKILTNGLSGLETLTALYCSTKFVIERMEEWAEQLVFVQLWDYCKDSDGESIFDASVREYRQLFSTIVVKYEEFFRKETRAALRDYVNSSSWSDPEQVQVSSKLSNFVAVLTAYMAHLKRSLPQIDYYIISSKVCNSYSRVLLEYVITNNQFTKSALAQFRRDLEYMDDSLRDCLLLDTSHTYNNCENKTRRKLLQSVDVLGHFDAAEAKVWINRDRALFGGVRSEFSHELSSLTESEISDLLFRIV